jgi:hypothetical protein
MLTVDRGDGKKLVPDFLLWWMGEMEKGIEGERNE